MASRTFKERLVDMRDWVVSELQWAGVAGVEPREDALTAHELLGQRDRFRAALRHIADASISKPSSFAERILAGDTIEQARAAAAESARQERSFLEDFDG